MNSWLHVKETTLNINLECISINQVAYYLTIVVLWLRLVEA